jgi:hypothetical protein
MSDKILIVKTENDKELNKFQRAFNANIQKINELKLQLSVNTAIFEKTRIKVASEIMPVQRKYLDKHVQLVFLFDSHYEDKFFKKKEKEKIADLIVNKCLDLMHSNPDEALGAIYEKYSLIIDPDYTKQTEEEEADLMKKMVGNMFGVDLDDAEFDPNDLDSVQEAVWEKMQEKNANKPKTKKQLEREEKQKEEELNVSKAAKSIYKDLVKSFHPDREQDEAEKLRKTEIMKRITAAFKKDDLYELLKLKIELLGSTINEMTSADTELKYYNKMLREQINELEAAPWQLNSHAKGLFPNQRSDFFMHFGKNENRVDTIIKTESNKLKNALKELEKNMIVLKEKQNVRDFLREYEIEEEDYDSFFF